MTKSVWLVLVTMTLVLYLVGQGSVENEMLLGVAHSTQMDNRACAADLLGAKSIICKNRDSR